MQRATHAILAVSFAALVAALALHVAGCGNDPTPASTVVLEESFEGDVDEPLEGDEPVAKEVVLAGGASVRVELTLARAGATKLVRRVRVVVVDPADAELAGAMVGSPTNVGTTDAPIHSRILQLTETRSGLTGTTTNQTSLTVRGDGDVAQR